MKTEINIVQGEVKIILHAENSFEKELVEKIKDGEYESCNIKSSVQTDYSYGSHRNHRIEVDLKEKEKAVNLRF